MCVKKIFIFPAAAACVVLSLSAVPAFSFYEPGLSAVSMGSAGGGAASLKSPEAALNPAAAAAAAGRLVLSSDYKLFFVGIPAENPDIVPGYLKPDPFEGRVEIFMRPSDGDIAAGAGFYSLNLAGRFSHRVLSVYAAAPLDNTLILYDGENLYGGASLKYMSLDYGRDEYTPSAAEGTGLSKSALTCDAGLLYSRGRASLGFVARNIVPADLGIYEEWRVPAEFIAAFAYEISPSIEIRMDFTTGGSGGFTGVTPSAEFSAGAAKIRMGVSPRQAAAGFGFAAGDFAFNAAFVYSRGIGGNFADGAAGISYRLR
jgi:hypothetical protein